MNAANEVAVAAFLAEEGTYLGIAACVEAVMDAHDVQPVESLEQLEAIHRRVQEFRRSKPLLTLDFWDGPSPSAAAPQGGTA